VKQQIPSHSLMLAMLVVIVTISSLGIGITYNSLHTTTSNVASNYGRQVRFSGTVLPFLSSATYLGPASGSRQLVLKFDPITSAPESLEVNLSDWERSVGLTPGLSECPVSVGVVDSNGSTSSWSSAERCSIDQLEVLTTIKQAETALNTTINSYSYDGQVFFANSQDPYVPSKIAIYLVDIEGLNNYTIPCCGPITNQSRVK